MAPVYALDHFYLLITFLVTVAYQLLGFTIAWTLQFDKITDFTGGSNFFMIALLTLLLGQNFNARNLVASTFVMIWAVRIAGFLLFRVLKRGKDSRFDEIRTSFVKFLSFWIGQIVWVWIVSLPVTILNSPGVSDVDNGGSSPAWGTSRDIAGTIIWSLGFMIEAAADVQKYRYKASRSASRDRPITTGLWGWSRHPPYFGEMLCWWGIWTLCLSPTTNGDLNFSARAAQKGAVVSPIFTFLLLMFVSGIPSAEKPQAKRFFLMSYGPDSSDGASPAWPRCKAYLKRTSILVPIPPPIYERVPAIVKRTILLDFPMYQFDENKDGLVAIAEAQRA